MSCYPVKIDLPCHELGDVYLGLGGVDPVTFELTEGSEPVTASYPLDRVRFVFTRRNKTFVLDSDPAQNPDHLITITDADLWTAEIDRIPEFLPTDGDWRWKADFYSEFFGGHLTLYKGILTVTR